MLVRLFFLLNIAASLATAATYAGAILSPALFWGFSILALGILPMLGVQFFFLICWLYFSPKKAWLPLLTLLLGFPFLKATFAFNFGTPEPAMLQVLSYNVQVFGLYDNSDAGKAKSKELTQWTANHPADIKCFQEFYHEPRSTIFDSKHQLRKDGIQHVYLDKHYINRIGGAFSMAIFSKYPMVNKAKIKFEGNTFNSAMYADIDLGQDTIRVINVHLGSFNMDEESFSFDRSNYEERSKHILWAFRRVSPGHVKQWEQVEAVVRQSPYPVVVCGDFNELPYGYVYTRAKKYMNNAFESAGAGFGFTFNHPVLFFLRIDHQFYNGRLKATHSKVDHTMPHSDHFPLITSYQLLPRTEQQPTTQ